MNRMATIVRSPRPGIEPGERVQVIGKESLYPLPGFSNRLYVLSQRGFTALMNPTDLEGGTV